MRVLLVEDSYFAAVDVQRKLEQLGCRVVGPVPSLREGLELASRESITAAILDINILGGSSAEIAELLLSRGVPFFFISGYTSPSCLPERLKNLTKVQKPVHAQVLAATVRREFLHSA